MEKEEGPDWYRTLLREKKKDSSYYVRMIQIVSEERDRCNKFNDQNLLCAQAFGRLEALKHGKKN